MRLPSIGIELVPFQSQVVEALGSIASHDAVAVSVSSLALIAGVPSTITLPDEGGFVMMSLLITFTGGAFTLTATINGNTIPLKQGYQLNTIVLDYVGGAPLVLVLEADANKTIDIEGYILG